MKKPLQQVKRIRSIETMVQPVQEKLQETYQYPYLQLIICDHNDLIESLFIVDGYEQLNVLRDSWLLVDEFRNIKVYSRKVSEGTACY